MATKNSETRSEREANQRAYLEQRRVSGLAGTGRPELVESRDTTSGLSDYSNPELALELSGKIKSLLPQVGIGTRTHAVEELVRWISQKVEEKDEARSRCRTHADRLRNRSSLPGFF